MPLTSRQRRLFSEQDPRAAAGKAPPAPAPAPAAPAAAPAPKKAPEAKGKPEGPPPGGNGSVDQGLKALEKLQNAAADIETARFAIQHVFSDFSLSRRLERLKIELVDALKKAKDHAMAKAGESPEAREKVAQWFDL